MTFLQNKHHMFWTRLLFVGSAIFLLVGCGKQSQPSNADSITITPTDKITTVSVDYVSPEEIDNAANMEPIANTYGDLSVLTYVNKIEGTYFLVDCYHNQIIYHDNLEDPIWQWNVLQGDLAMPHTIASDGTFYLVDDTENHRVIVYEKRQENYVITQIFNQVGNRPHFIYYNEADQTFYVWSSMTGEMYLFRRNSFDENPSHENNGQSAKGEGIQEEASDSDAKTDCIQLVEVRKIDRLDGIYVRSFTIVGNEIYFVSGNSSIIRANLADFSTIEEYPVPAELAGMIQLTKLGDYYYITISTDVTGNQDFATMIKTKDLNSLANGDYEDIYSLFVGGGTPYYISQIGDEYYLTEHRIPGHSLWKFHATDTELVDIIAIY